MEQKALVRLNDHGHFIYIDEVGQFIVEWYDFGDDAPCESANMLILGDSQLPAISDRVSYGCVPDLDYASPR